MKTGKGLNRYFPKYAHQKYDEGSVRSDLKNSTPSPWKRRKTTSSAFFCATGAWLLKTEFNEFEQIQNYQIQIFGWVRMFVSKNEQNVWQMTWLTTMAG